MRKTALLFLIVFVIVSCSSDALSVRKATSLINDYTREHPVYESESIHLGERKLRVQKDEQEIEALKKLEKENLIALKTNELRKKFWSKDSIWDVTITLTSDASKYVIDQRKNKAEVKTYLFTIQEKSEVALELNTKTKATAKAKLIKEPTPFAALSKDRNPHSEFIMRNFTLKFGKETGWYVQK
ncbi:MAG TPA: hypothetical protein VKY44_00330 [Flavobacterium sp.]|nr:hypothetical protein [Flavobacterium sp.]